MGCEEIKGRRRGGMRYYMRKGIRQRKLLIKKPYGRDEKVWKEDVLKDEIKKKNITKERIERGIIIMKKSE